MCSAIAKQKQTNITNDFLLSKYFTQRYIPESLRWLQLRGRNDEVKVIFNRISQLNKRDLPDFELKEFKDTTSQGFLHFIHIFKPMKIAVRSLIQGYMWQVY